MITEDWTLARHKHEAAFLICGDDEQGWIEVDLADRCYDDITYH